MIAQPRPDDFTDILYKYTDLNGVEKILTNRTLRFTRPSEMNDPFDVRIDEWMAMKLGDFYELAGPLIKQRLLSRPDVLMRKTGMNLEQARAVTDDFGRQPESEKSKMLKGSWQRGWL